MDAFEIGYALAFPAGLAAGLVTMGTDFELLDAASAAAGDDAALAAGALEPLRMAWAPDEQAGSDEGPGEAAEGPVLMSTPVGAAAGGRGGGAGVGTGRGSRSGADGGVLADPKAAGAAGARSVRSASVHRGATRVDGPGAGGAGLSGGFVMGDPGVAPRDTGAEGINSDVSRAAAVPAEIVVVTVPAGPGSGGGRRGGARRGTGGGAPVVSSGRSTAGAYAEGTTDRQLDAAGVPDTGLRVIARVAEAMGAAGSAIAPSARRGSRGPGRTDQVDRWVPEESVAPVAGGAVRGPGSQGTPVGGLFEQRAVAPQEASGSGRDEGGRPVILDGRLVGHWLSERMARDAARPGAGTTFFDPRQAPAWTPSGVL